MNQKIMFAMMIAVVALVATGAIAISSSGLITSAYAAKPQHCSQSSHSCFPSEQQCIRHSPGNSGRAQC